MRRGELGMMLLALTALGGCAAADPLAAPAPLEPVRLSYELLDRRQVVLGPALPLGEGRQRLRTRISEDGTVTHHLLVEARYRATGWHYYETATAGGAALAVRATDRGVGTCTSLSWLGCDHAESLEVALPEALVADAAAQGLAVEIGARDGAALTVRLTQQQIATQRDLVAAAR